MGAATAYKCAYGATHDTDAVFWTTARNRADRGTTPGACGGRTSIANGVRNTMALGQIGTYGQTGAKGTGTSS